MKNYDVIVMGSGSGMYFVEEAQAHGLRVALIDRGPLGGTCLNLGCIPSKMLIYPADIVAEIQEAKKLGWKRSLGIIVGKEARLKEGRKYLFIGDCTQEWWGKGAYVAGCPPEREEIVEALREKMRE